MTSFRLRLVATVGVVGATAIPLLALPSTVGANSTQQAVCLNNICVLTGAGTADSDGDGYSDIDENAYGSDPNDAASHPPANWLFQGLLDATLPSLDHTNALELVSVLPDGTAVTITPEAMFGSLGKTFGFTMPDRAKDAGLTIAPPGFDIGSITGGQLSRESFPGLTRESKSATPQPQIGPNTAEYGNEGDGWGATRYSNGTLGPYNTASETKSRSTNAGRETLTVKNVFTKDGVFIGGTRTDVEEGDDGSVTVTVNLVNDSGKVVAGGTASCKSDCDTRQVTEKASSAAAASMGVRQSTPPSSSTPDSKDGGATPPTTAAPESSAPPSSGYVDPDYSDSNGPLEGFGPAQSDQPPVEVGCRTNCNAGDTGVTPNGGPTNTLVHVAYIDEQIGLTVVETPDGPVVVNDATLGVATGDYSDRGLDFGGTGPRNPNRNY
jgi:hypothetical protein